MKISAFALAGFLAFVSPIHAQEAADEFYSLSVQDLRLTSGEIPKGSYAWNWRDAWQARQFLGPEVALDGTGEAYLTYQQANYFSQGDFSQVFPSARLAVRAPAGKAISGHLYVPKNDWSGVEDLAFTLDAKDAKPEHRAEFFEAKKSHYERLAGLDIPGAGWFRHQVALAKKKLGVSEAAPPIPSFQGDVRFRGNGMREDSVEEAFELFSGGRALAENLQLDRVMPAGAEAEETVPLAEIEGIKTRAYDWKAKLAGKEPKLDALASFVPADQFALFFPSFEAMTTLLDEAERTGTPILQSLEPRGEDALTKSRYEKQLCLEMTVLARMFGPQVVEEVAMTASDPYLREGSDVALLFRAKPGKAKALAEFVRAKQKAAGGGTSEDRSVSSVLREMGEVIVIANSTTQADKIEATAKRGETSLSAQEDYKFFRTRYEKGASDETAFLMLPDAAIRNWCSPRWRIAESRRLRAAAVLAELQAQNMDALLAGKIPAAGKIETSHRVLGGGEFSLERGGVRHSIYGSLNFLTPIAEIPLEKVTKQEADLYKRWKQGYENNWSNFFDPIAVRFSVKPEKAGLDVSVMPLILGTHYRTISQMVREGEAMLPPDACDPHGALLHYAMSINPDSEPFREASKFVIGMAPQLKPNPFQWIGNSAALFVDDDPIWAEMANDWENYFEKHAIRLPVGLWVEVKNPLALAAFLTGLRSMVNMTAPGMTKWDTIEENGQSFVKITATVDGPHRRNGDGDEDDDEKPAGELKPGQMAIYYVTTPSSFLLTLDEGVLKRYLARHGKDAKTADSSQHRPWLGGSYCVQADPKLLQTFHEVLGVKYAPQMQARSWSNLPILNEWKKLYPDRDPLEVHRQIWGTQLLCVAGGDYVWNEKTHSMESTLCGSPRAPKSQAKLPAILEKLRYGNFGLTFEEGGLRARAEVERTQ